MRTLRQAVASYLRGWLLPPPEGPWWTEAGTWRAAIDTGFAQSAIAQVAPDFIFCHRGRFLAIDLLEPGQEISEINGSAIWAAGGIPATCKSIEEVVAVLEAFGVRSYASLDPRVEAAALHIQ